MAQIHVRLDKETKAEWKDYAEQQGYDSLSRLIRKAVESQRNGTQPATQPSQADQTVSLPDNIATANDVNQIDNALLKLVDRIEDMESRLEMTEKAALEPRDTKAVMEALPRERPDPEDRENYQKVREPDYENPSGGVAIDGTAESIAAVVEEPAPPIKAFLSESAHLSDKIQAEKIGGKLRFWVNNDE